MVTMHSLAAAATHDPAAPLEKLLQDTNGDCTRCSACQQDCAFLKKYGTPGELAESYDPAHKFFQSLPFECSLCGLCTAVCPVKLTPDAMFLAMRREKLRRAPRDCPEHAGFLAFEKRSTSPRFSYYGLPDGCEAVFFPGCSLAGTRADTTHKIYEHLRKGCPGLGVVLDCCLKISHDLGRERSFAVRFREMKDFLVQRGVKKVLVACPNCYRIFSAYGGELAVGTIYEYLDKLPLPHGEKAPGTVAIHDPCPLRFSPDVQAAVRNLVKKLGLSVAEMPHQGENTLCCGVGGLVGSLAPKLAGNWASIIKAEAAGRRLITYCACCANHLQMRTPTSHIVDLLWEPRTTLDGKVKVTKAPLTYLKRLLLKKRLKETITAPLKGERHFTAEGRSNIS